MLEARFYELVQIANVKFCIGDAFDYDRKITLDREDKNSYVNYLDYQNEGNYEYMAVKDEYAFTLSKPMTELDCSFFKFEMAKQYVTITCQNASIKHDLNFAEIARLIVEKNKDVFQIKSDYLNPSICDLQKIGVPYADVNNRNIIFFGSPSYIDWSVVNGRLFVWPETLKKLENLEVSSWPELTITEVCSDTIKWSIHNKKYKYKFSDTAKAANENQNERYWDELEEFEDWVKAGSRDGYDDNDHKPSWKYTDQDFIDDAFGGEASAYWNID